MATQFDMILRDSQSVATIYDSSVNNPEPVRVAITNYAGLKTVRSSYDFITSMFYPKTHARPAPTPGQVFQNTAGWFLIAKVMDQSRGFYNFNPPLRCLTLHFDYLLTVYRVSGDITTILVMTREDAQSHGETDDPFERITMIVPIGAKVSNNDQVVYDVWIYRVAEKLPENLDGHQYAYRLILERFIALGGPGDPSGSTIIPVDYLLTNAFVSIMRRDESGVMQLVNPRQAVRYIPQKLSGFATQGDFENVVMYVTPDVDLEDLDVVELLEVDGHQPINLIDDISTFSATISARIPAPLPVIQVKLIGFEQ